MRFKLFSIRCILWLKRIRCPSVFLICSSPRSGSTWLGELLSSDEHTILVFEPLHLKYVPAAEKAGFEWRTYRHPNEVWPQGKKFLSKIFQGRIINEWTTKELSISKSFLCKRLITKFVRATRLLPWICTHFNLPPPILLIRHPCAVVASQLQRNYWKSMSRPSIPPFLDDHLDLQNLIRSSNSVEEYLAITWCLDYFPAFATKRPHPWQVISYEELIIDQHKALDKIKRSWHFVSGVEFPRVHEKSSTTYKSGTSGLTGWMKSLTLEQKEKIIRIAHGFGFTFYTLDSASPNFDALSPFEPGR
jgi:hypothetical protein